MVSPVLPNRQEIDALLLPLGPMLAAEADTLLDLRELMIVKGHPGKCVRCFLQLFTAAGTDSMPKLTPLRTWIERHFEISVSADGRELEALPITFRPGDDLEAFCLRSIRKMRLDRSYPAKRLDLSFRYKKAAA
jgi:hypothetical protein